MTKIVAIDARLVGGTSTGDSTYWTGLLEGLSRTESEFRFLLFSNAPRPSGLPPCDWIEWRTLPARSSRWWSLVKFPLAARRAQVVHTQYSVSPLVRRPAVTTVHDVSFFIGPEWFRPKDRMLLRATVPAACRRAARVVAVSETCKSEIEHWIPAAKGKVSVTYNACPSWIQPVPREQAALRVRQELGLEGPFLLTVGTRWPRKNMGLAIAAANLLPREVPHRMVVTGKTGWGENELGPRGFASGYVDNVLLSALYSAASMYLAPSRHEGFGIPLLEAFRCGCPVICSTGGALPEVAGDAAIVEPSWEAADWAVRIQRAIGDRGTLSALREKGHIRERRFTWEETARKTLEIYREVAN